MTISDTERESILTMSDDGDVTKLTASLWGIEPFPDAAYTRTLIADLLSELNA